MAGDRLPYQPPIKFAYKIIRVIKKFYEKEPSAEPQHMIHQVYVTLINQIHMDEAQFGQYVSKMIDAYLNLSVQMDDPSNCTDPKNRWVIDKCPYFLELNEACQLSHHYYDLVMGPNTRPIASDAQQSTRSTSSEVEAELHSMNEGATSSEPEAERSG